MTEFKVGDRVRLIEDCCGVLNKGFESTVVEVFSSYCVDQGRQAKQLVCFTTDHLNGGRTGVFDFRLKLIKRPWEFEVGKYYRNIERPEHIVRVDAFTPETVSFTIVSSLGYWGSRKCIGKYKEVKEVWEPCPDPKVMVKKSGWIIVEHRDTIKGSKAIAQCPVFDTKEAAKKWVSDKFHHVKIESVKYYKIEWEEEDDDMV